MSTSTSFARWLTQHRAQLLSTALPAHVWQSERKWLYFLEHGDLPADSEGPAARLDQLPRADVLTLIVVVDDYERTHPRAANAIRPILTRLVSS